MWETGEWRDGGGSKEGGASDGEAAKKGTQAARWRVSTLFFYFPTLHLPTDASSTTSSHSPQYPRLSSPPPRASRRRLRVLVARVHGAYSWSSFTRCPATAISVPRRLFSHPITQIVEQNRIAAG